MAIPVGLGFALDYFLNTLPWFTVIGAILGPVLGFWHLLVILRTPLPDDEKKP
jgi:F0F1-type ATP synthase assembly protein I